MDGAERVMKKCTLCIDRIYNETIAEPERQPACVVTCPTRARHFGDLADPDSAVSKLVAERGGFALMPELGYRPTNRYLPPRAPKRGCGEPVALEDASPAGGFLGWLDRALGG
jgi:Fe-S-cluster-containing dehydrogenase component